VGILGENRERERRKVTTDRDRELKIRSEISLLFAPFATTLTHDNYHIATNSKILASFIVDAIFKIKNYKSFASEIVDAN
jgi:hypothetical protein